MARPVKRWFLHLITINARNAGDGSNQTVAGGGDSNENMNFNSNGIVKQESSRGYLVKTNGGLGRVRLVATDDLDVGQAFIKATDDNGNTYFVTKLTAHKATLVRWTNNESEWLFETGDTAQWSDGRHKSFSYNGNGVVIENDI